MGYFPGRMSASTFVRMVSTRKLGRDAQFESSVTDNVAPCPETNPPPTVTDRLTRAATVPLASNTSSLEPAQRPPRRGPPGRLVPVATFVAGDEVLLQVRGLANRLDFLVAELVTGDGVLPREDPSLLAHAKRTVLIPGPQGFDGTTSAAV